VAFCSSGRVLHGQRASVLCRLRAQVTAQVDQGVGDDSEADAALHSIASAIAAPLQPAVPLHDADAPFAAGSPFLPLSEPALLSMLECDLRARCREVPRTLGYESSR
jgi:hypothetical protein